jgi:hypothetical protein
VHPYSCNTQHIRGERHLAPSDCAYARVYWLDVWDCTCCFVSVSICGISQHKVTDGYSPLAYRGIECSLIILAASLPALRQCCRLLTVSLKSFSHQGASIAHPPGDPNRLVRTENPYLPPRPCEMPRLSVPSRVALGREEVRLSISYGWRYCS